VERRKTKILSSSLAASLMGLALISKARKDKRRAKEEKKLRKQYYSEALSRFINF
jgi:hypothetical protein